MRFYKKWPPFAWTSTRPWKNFRAKVGGLVLFICRFYIIVLNSSFVELRFKDPELHYRVNIGLPSKHKSRPEQLQDRLKVLKQKRSDGELEKLARHNQCNM